MMEGSHAEADSGLLTWNELHLTRKGGSPVKPWEQYQYRTAELLSQLGFTTKVNDPLRASNGVVHRVDVSARMVVAGVSTLWVTECKLWNKAVTKEKVSALKDIVNDLGADRGLLMSEKGFQSGAIRLAATKNISLSSLDEVRANAADQLLAVRIETTQLWAWSIVRVLMRFRRVPRWVSSIPEEDRTKFVQRAAATDFTKSLVKLAQRVGYTSDEERLVEIFTYKGTWGVWKEGVDTTTISETAAVIWQAMIALDQAKEGRWPVPFETPDGPKLAWTTPQLLDLVEPAITQLGERVFDVYEKLMPAEVRYAVRTLWAVSRINAQPNVRQVGDKGVDG